MKNLLLLLTIGLIQMSCKNELMNREENFQIKSSMKTEMSEIRAELLSYHDSLQKSYYLELTPADHLEIWQDKVNQIIEYGGWNSTQDSLLLEVQGSLDIDAFSDDSLDVHAYMENFGFSWEIAALTAFGYDNFVVLFMQPHDYDGEIVYHYAPYGGDDPDCTCNKRAAVSSCSLQVPVTEMECKPLSCGYGRKGCGWFFLQSCNARCSVF